MFFLMALVYSADAMASTPEENINTNPATTNIEADTKENPPATTENTTPKKIPDNSSLDNTPNKLAVHAWVTMS